MRSRKAEKISGGWRVPWGRAGALAAALVLPGCPDDKPQSCGGPVPAFSVTLQASDGPVPEDAVLSVMHGAGEEVFDLDGSCLISDVLFCSPPNRGCEDPQDAGDWDASVGPPPVESLVCKLWTDGAAQITVKARGYVMLDRTLEPNSNAGCVETVDVTLTLERGDAGP